MSRPAFRPGTEPNWKQRETMTTDGSGGFATGVLAKPTEGSTTLKLKWLVWTAAPVAGATVREFPPRFWLWFVTCALCVATPNLCGTILLTLVPTASQSMSLGPITYSHANVPRILKVLVLSGPGVGASRLIERVIANGTLVVAEPFDGHVVPGESILAVVGSFGKKVIAGNRFVWGEVCTVCAACYLGSPVPYPFTYPSLIISIFKPCRSFSSTATPSKA